MHRRHRGSKLMMLLAMSATALMPTSGENVAQADASGVRADQRVAGTHPPSTAAAIPMSVSARRRR
ncbi:putative exported protein of unknown function (plasmid) [Bradyrhizobium sp. BTAi1]|nr:putative exported protein of unknown function [Bradyrhizobium sp. BTAi1]